ncbi:MAG TPA: acetate--CoA ligase family protein [Candidatus Limnocylindria bacterium]|nr:acetate--CoA ligase family protein [Candidatus Limnocylindria bacterium]
MSVARLLNPASIAIVGASDKVGPGFNAWRALEYVGYRGRVFLVNPRTSSVMGRPTYPSLAAIPEAVDAAFIAVPRDAVLDAVRAAADKGAGGVAVLSSGFGEAGEAGAAAERELAAIARDGGMAVCGPNCLGFLNFAGATALFGTSLPDTVARGGVAVVAQSGSIGIALLNCARGIGLSHLITSGNEAVTTAADYLDALIDDPAVTTVIAFLEQLRKPEHFVEVARRAYTLGKPVIVVKSGRSERGRQAVMAHTGAVAGSDAVCDAAFRAASVIRVGTLDELIETAVLVSSVKARPTAPGVAIVSPSGGEIALALDIADAAGLELPPVPGAQAAIAALLPDFAHATNPLDLTWAGLYDPTVAQRCVEALGAQAEIGALVLLQDAPAGLGEQQALRYASLFRHVALGAAATAKPFAVVSNLAGELHPAFDAVARETGVPCLRGTQEGLGAMAQFARWATTPPLPPAPGAPAGVRDEARRRLAALPAARVPAEHEGRHVLAAYGIGGPREIAARDADDAAKAARSIGYPVVLKGIVPGMAHKTEAGMVKLRLASDDDVRRAAAEVMAAAGEGVTLLVQEMVQPVAEILVGARIDADFGPIVVVGAGGVMVELYRDVAIRLAPVTESVALQMIGQTRAASLLSGWRGRPRGDLQQTAATVAALSRLIADFRDEIAEVEINPLGVLEEGRGVLALDCLVVRAGGASA